MNRELIALLMSLIAGMATLLGSFIIFFTNGKNEKILSICLGLACGVMISVSFWDLYTSGVESLSLQFDERMSTLIAILAFALGIIASALLDHFVPHDVDEHHNQEHKDLYRLGFFSLIAIALHNFPEGIATYASSINNIELGFSIMLAIALHNIPEGIVVAIPIYYSTKKKTKAIFYTFLSGISEFVGALLAFLIIGPFISNALLGFLLAFVAGLMVYIALEELLPESRQYGYSRLALWSMFIGIILMPLTHVII